MRLDTGVGAACGLRSICAGFARSRGIEALRVMVATLSLAKGAKSACSATQPNQTAEKNRIYFKTAAEAEAAGYKKAGNCNK
jgi:hypothetical protein